jgi:hypothetical protein
MIPILVSGEELMKLAITASAVLLLASGAAGAQTLEDLKNDGKNPDNILTCTATESNSIEET